MRKESRYLQNVTKLSTIQYSIVLYCTALYCLALYCTYLRCIILYCTILYCWSFPQRGPVFRSLVFKPIVLFVVVVVAALFVFGGLHFDLLLCLTRAFLAFKFILSLRCDLNKNSSKPCAYLTHVLEKTRLK